MNIGFHSVGLHSRPIEEVCRRVRDAGYAAIELNAERLPWAEPHVTPTMSADTLAAIARACAEAGLPVSSICAHIPLVSADLLARNESLRYVKSCIDNASTLGTTVVHVISGAPDRRLSDNDNWRQFVSSLEELAEHAGGRGVALGVEAVVGQICASLSHLDRLFSDLRGTAMFLNFDPSHFFVQGEDPVEVIDRFGDKVIHVHVKDGLGRFPEFKFPPLGLGGIEFPHLFGRLRSAGYSGVVSVEYEAQAFGYHWSEDDVLAKSFRFVREALNAAEARGAPAR